MNGPLLALLVIGGVIGAVCFGLLLVAMSAPWGVEDAEGFREIERPE